MRRRLQLLMILTLTAGNLGAQTRVNGIVWDSLRGIPLSDAFVTLASRAANTDSAGRFTLDSVPAGAHVLAVQHSVLDSIGLPGITQRITVRNGMDTIRASVPSFARMWAVACGAALASPGRGFVFGSVRDGTSSKPATGAKVSARWTDISVGGKSALSQKNWRADATADTTGTYVLCNVPIDHALSMSATTTDLASGEIAVVVDSMLGIRRQDLLIGTKSTGVVAGAVVDERGAGVADARVTVANAPEVRTRADGSFRVLNVPTGSQQIEALVLGSAPATRVVDVVADDTARVELTMHRVQQLDSMKVVATSTRQGMFRDLDDRKKIGIGQFRDSTDLARQPGMVTVFQQFSSSITVVNDGSKRSMIGFRSQSGMKQGLCTPTLWIDNHNKQAITPNEVYTEVRDLDPKDIAALEVYVRPTEVPPQFVTLRPGVPLCGAIVIWTKHALP